MVTLRDPIWQDLTLCIIALRWSFIKSSTLLKSQRVEVMHTRPTPVLDIVTVQPLSWRFSLFEIFVNGIDCVFGAVVEQVYSGAVTYSREGAIITQSVENISIP